MIANNPLLPILMAVPLLGNALAIALREFKGDPEADLLTEWIAYHRISRGLSGSALATYIRKVRFMKHWATSQGKRLQDLTPKCVDNYHKFLYLEKNHSSHARSQSMSSARSFYAWAEQFYNWDNPTQFLVGPKIPKLLPRKYSDKELKRLFQTFDHTDPFGLRDYTYLLTMWATGARAMELADMRLDQIQLEERVGSLRFFGKGSKERKVGFEGAVVTNLKKWLAVKEALSWGKNEWLFPSMQGTPLRHWTAAKRLEIHAKKANIKKWKLHWMRSTFATNLYDLGEDINTIKLIMGHEDLRTTERYIAISERRLRTRMPTSRIKEIIGQADEETPLWVRQKLGVL